MINDCYIMMNEIPALEIQTKPIRDFLKENNIQIKVQTSTTAVSDLIELQCKQQPALIFPHKGYIIGASVIMDYLRGRKCS